MESLPCTARCCQDMAEHKTTVHISYAAMPNKESYKQKVDRRHKTDQQ